MLGTLKIIYTSKTELETVNGNGVERRKRTYIICYMVTNLSNNLCFYIYIASDFILNKITSMKY